MIEQRYQSIIVQTVGSLLIPFVQLFALYVIIHGHYGPGGGFQGGVLLAVSIILQRLYLGVDIAHRKFAPRAAPVLATTGMLIFILAGLVPMLYGASFLDYGGLPLFWVHGAELRALGILIVEVGIGLAVFGTLILIFDNLAGERW